MFNEVHMFLLSFWYHGFMDDKPKPLYTPIVPEVIGQAQPDMLPEEVAPEIIQPEEVLKTQSASPPAPPSNTPPPTEHLIRYGVLAGGAIFFILIFALIFRLILGGKSSGKTVELQYWGLWEEAQVFEPLIAQYQSKHPNVKIVYQKMSSQDYREKLLARSKNGQGPDIFRFHNTWLPEIRDVASPIPPSVMSGAEFEKTFYPVHSKDLKVGSYYYGIPLEIDGLVLIFNNGLFKKAGISKVPISWEEILEDVPKLSVKTKDGKIITSGLAIGTASNVEHFAEIFGLMLKQNGGDLRKLDQAEAAGTLEAYRKLAEAPSNFWDDTMPNSIPAFVQEKVAMIIAPSWEVLSIKAQNPDIDLKVAPVPVLPGTSSISLASYWVEGVSKTSKNQLEAWQFLKFLSEKETMTKLYELESKTRLFGEPYSRVDLAGSLASNQYIGVVVAQAKNFTSMPVVGRTNDNGLNDEIVQNIQNAINATITGVSYSQALVSPKQGIDQVLKRFNVE